jgi:hypothetical protein
MWMSGDLRGVVISRQSIATAASEGELSAFDPAEGFEHRGGAGLMENERG